MLLSSQCNGMYSRSKSVGSVGSNAHSQGSTSSRSGSGKITLSYDPGSDYTSNCGPYCIYRKCLSVASGKLRKIRAARSNSRYQECIDYIYDLK